MATVSHDMLDRTALTDTVRAAQDGDREAFGILAERYESAVYAIALRRLGNRAEAQELTQEVLVKAMERLHQLRLPERFGGWLRSIAVRMAINRAVRSKPVATAEPAVLETTYARSATPLDLRDRRRSPVHLYRAR